LQLLFEPVLTMQLFKERKGILCGPVWTGQYSEMLQAERFGDRKLAGANFFPPLQIDPRDHL